MAPLLVVACLTTNSYGRSRRLNHARDQYSRAMAGPSLQSALVARECGELMDRNQCLLGNLSGRNSSRSRRMENTLVTAIPSKECGSFAFVMVASFELLVRVRLAHDSLITPARVASQCAEPTEYR